MSGRPGAGGRSDGQRRLALLLALVALLAFVVLAALVGAHAGGGLDGRVLDWLAARRRQPLTGLAVALDVAGRWYVLGPAVVALALVLWSRGRAADARALLLTVALSFAVNLALKAGFERQPPGVDTVVPASRYAFPSGHTMTTAALATALAVLAWPTRWRRPAAAAGGLAAAAMALSRVYLGVHWPSDVAAGLALGVAVALGVALVLGRLPAPPAGGAAAGAGAGADADDGIEVVFLDWGNTLMVDDGTREGPMKDWDEVAAVPGAAEALARLHGRYRLVVLTNAEDSPADAVRAALARVGLDRYVDDVVSSADVGDRKPNYTFFRTALLRVGRGGLPLDPRRAVMVGDGTTNDVLGAQRAGLRTVWFNEGGRRRYPEGQAPPDAVIRSLAELPGAVARLTGRRPPG